MLLRYFLHDLGLKKTDFFQLQCGNLHFFFQLFFSAHFINNQLRHFNILILVSGILSILTSFILLCIIILYVFHVFILVTIKQFFNRTDSFEMLLEASFHIAIHPLILFYDEYSNYYKSNLCIIIVHKVCFMHKFIRRQCHKPNIFYFLNNSLEELLCN